MTISIIEIVGYSYPNVIETYCNDIIVESYCYQNVIASLYQPEDINIVGYSYPNILHARGK